MKWAWPDPQPTSSRRRYRRVATLLIRSTLQALMLKALMLRTLMLKAFNWS
jgi:hypothetical protein